MQSKHIAVKEKDDCFNLFVTIVTQWIGNYIAVKKRDFLLL